MENKTLEINNEEKQLFSLYNFKAPEILKQKEGNFNFLVVRVNTTTKVIKSGKKQRISLIIVAGNGQGSLGLGIGRGDTVENAFEKAKINAIKNIFNIPISGAKSVFHSVYGKKKKTSVLILPKLFGKGLRASPLVYSILKMAGIHNACSKQFGSKNKLNIIYATILALKTIENDNDLAYNKYLEVEDLLRRVNC